MAEATRRHGYAYFGVADHSQSAHYAAGCPAMKSLSSTPKIDSLNKRYGESSAS